MSNYLKINWSDIVLIICLYFLAGFFSNLIILFSAKIFHINSYLVSPIGSLVSYIFTFTAYYFIALKKRNEKLMFSYSFNGFQLLPIALVLFFGQFLITEYLTGLIPTTPGSFLGNLYENMTYALLGNANTHPFITFTLACIIAPICEEMLFRGIILKGMLNNKVQPVTAIIISAIIFGGIHLFPWQVVGGFLSGIILGLTFYKTGSLLTCTLLHFLNNLTGFLLFMKYKSLKTPDIGFNEFLLLPIGVVTILIFGYLYLKLTKNNTWKYY